MFVLRCRMRFVWEGRIGRFVGLLLGSILVMMKSLEKPGPALDLIGLF